MYCIVDSSQWWLLRNGNQVHKFGAAYAQSQSPGVQVYKSVNAAAMLLLPFAGTSIQMTSS